MKGSMKMPVTAKPYKHQQAAFDYVCRLFGLTDGKKRSPGVALLMEMGTGKTLVAIAVACILYQFGLAERVLVVAPLSLLGVWKSELQRFAGVPVNVIVMKGTLEKKKQLLSEAARDKLNIVIVNYESAWRLEKELLAYNADLIIADEAHKIKEGRTNQSRGLHKLGDKARFKLLLTGTLITNRELDVWSQYRFVNPTIFGVSFYVFRNHFFDMVGYGNHIPSFRKSQSRELLKRLYSVAYRVTKSEALDLPDTTEETRYVELEPKAAKLYRELARESYAAMGRGEITASNVLTKILRLSQVTGGFVGDDDKSMHAVSTAKMEALDDILDAIMADGKKLVIMARFVTELDGIVALLEKRGIGYAQVRGGIRDRAEEVRRFQEDENCRVFVGQIAAAGLGLTLTAADTLVFYSMDYSMSNFTQAQARIHRIGAKGTCHYLYLIARGTIDEQVIKALRNKVDLAKFLVDDYRHGCNPLQACPALHGIPLSARSPAQAEQHRRQGSVPAPARKRAGQAGERQQGSDPELHHA